MGQEQPDFIHPANVDKLPFSPHRDPVVQYRQQATSARQMRRIQDVRRFFAQAV
jgi:hypothetical protein